MSEVRNFDLNLLVAFKLLLEEGSVSRAAEKMFVSPSAMSHILQRLRQQLNDPVLVRTSKGMEPTERALSLLAPISNILGEVAKIINDQDKFVAATRACHQLGDSRRRICVIHRRLAESEGPTNGASSRPTG
jgi:DNA-binding transcriptional LysR family regulator